MRCSSCGAEIDSDSLFCSTCGAPITQSRQAAGFNRASQPQSSTTDLMTFPQDEDWIQQPKPHAQPTTPPPSNTPPSAVGGNFEVLQPSGGLGNGGGREDNRPISPKVPIIAAIALVAVIVALFLPFGGHTIDQQEFVQGVFPKDGLNDYSWDELKTIADAIALANNDEEALSIASAYHLVNDKGHIDQKNTKTVELANGQELHVQIIGFRHDDLPDGSGKAGITFLFTECVDMRTVADPATAGHITTKGGWENCYLRSWLQSRDGEGFWSQLPSSLRDNITAVDKISNNVGIVKGDTTNNASWNTKDSIWILSAKEICGEDAGRLSYRDDSNEILLKAGEQYQFFKEQGIRHNGKNAALKRKYDSKNVEWWLRDPASKNSDRAWRTVTSDGQPDDMAFFDEKQYGIVPGFCL